MCVACGANAHLCSAVVGLAELRHQGLMEVGFAAQLDNVASGLDMQTWVRPGGMFTAFLGHLLSKRTGNEYFGEVEASRVFVI